MTYLERQIQKQENRREYMKEWAYKKPLIKKICVVCNKEFETSLSYKINCSKECEYKTQKKKSLERYRNKKELKIIEEKRICKECEGEFIWASSSPKQLYCSKECSKEFWKKKRKDMGKGIIIKGNGQRENYYKLRFEIFKRDNFTCQYCGRNVKEDKIKLHCDHIHPKSKEGLFIANNLITSCEECNSGKGNTLLSEHLLQKRENVTISFKIIPNKRLK